MIDFSHTAARPLGADDDAGRRQTWKPLALLNVYRLVLSGLLAFIALTHIELTPLGEYHPLLFVAISVAYFKMALKFTVTLRASVPNFTLQLHAQHLTEFGFLRLQTGVFVIDPFQRIRLIMESAWQLLGFPTNPSRQTLHTLSPELAHHLDEWQQQPYFEPQLVRPTAGGPELLPRFAKLGQGARSGTLIFLENTAALAQQAQQMKLASLGRLTASIAHEIRNPLGAISHAGQLLAESPQLAEGDVRLTEIIREHSRRMNAIVENVLQLSRRQRARPQELALKPWLQQFISDFCLTQNIGAEHITLDVNPPDTIVRMDPQQLHQILWNLCHNGVRYSLAQSGTPRLRLRAGATADAHTPFLDVIDFGKGVAPEAVDHLFEPFFTTETTGTGLGLYITQEQYETKQT